MKYLFYKTVRFILKPFVKLLFNPKIYGLEEVNKEEAIILAGNHTSQLDALIIPYGPKRVVHMMAKKELFDSVFTRWFFKLMQCISVNRSIHDKNAKNTAIEVLKNNGLVGIFPEGTINKTNDIIMPFKYGAVSIANKSNAKIIPFSITGSYFKRNITVCYGKPYKVGSDLEKENKKLMDKVTKLIKENQK